MRKKSHVTMRCTACPVNMFSDGLVCSCGSEGKENIDTIINRLRACMGEGVVGRSGGRRYCIYMHKSIHRCTHNFSMQGACLAPVSVHVKQKAPKTEKFKVYV